MRQGTQQVFSGNVLIGDDTTLTPASIIVENGRITSIEEVKKVPNLWIFPALFNAHTHLGDTVAMDCAAGGDLVSLVTPPDGLKHRILRSTSKTEIIGGMKRSISLMMERGTAGCADFREGGKDGILAVQEAAANLPFSCMTFGREGGETIGAGLGVSSTRDVADLERIVAAARRNGKKIAFHAGEKDSFDVDAALSFHPDLIIHATHATDVQLKQCAENDIPIAVCPRSNWMLSVTDSARHPRIQRMIELGCQVFLGTDNVMFVQPDLFSEMAFLHTVYRISPHDVIRMAVNGSLLLPERFSVIRGARANFFVVDPRSSNLSYSKNPITSLVNRGASTSICKNVFNS